MSLENHTNGNNDVDTFAVRASLREITDAARYHTWVIVATCLLTLGIVTIYVIMWPPIFKASTTIVAEKDSDVARDAFYGSWDVFRKDDPKADIELMRAGPILQQVIEREQLSYDDVYHPFLSHLAYLWEKSWVGRQYREIKASIFPPDKTSPSRKEMELARTIEDLRAGILIEPVGNANVGTITVSGPSRRVAGIANTLLEVYLADRTARHVEEAQQSYDALTKEVEAADKDLGIAEQERLKFAEENEVAFDFQKEGLEVGKLTDLEQIIAGSRSKIAGLEASLSEVEDQIQNQPAERTTATVFEQNAVREAARIKKLDLEAALIHTRGRYREDSPEVQELQREMDEVDAVIASTPEQVEKATTEGPNQLQQELLSRRNSLESDLKGARASTVVLEELADKISRRIQEVPALQTKMRSLDRTFEWARDRHLALLGKQTQASISLASSRATAPSMSVVERAVPPGDVSWPKLKYLYPAALVIGLILGMCAALLLNYAGGRIRREHVDGGRREAPFYGTIGVPARAQSFAVLPTGKTAPIPSPPPPEL